MEDGGGAEERGGVDVGKELFNVVEVKVRGGGWAEDGGGRGWETRRRRERRGERRLNGFEGFCGSVVAEVP